MTNTQTPDHPLAPIALKPLERGAQDATTLSLHLAGREGRLPRPLWNAYKRVAQDVLESLEAGGLATRDDMGRYFLAGGASGADEITAKDILDSDTYITASALKKGCNGVYVNEVYKGRLMRLEKTDVAYVIQLDNPSMEFAPENCVDAVEIIKREMGNLPG